LPKKGNIIWLPHIFLVTLEDSAGFLCIKAVWEIEDFFVTHHRVQRYNKYLNFFSYLCSRNEHEERTMAAWSLVQVCSSESSAPLAFALKCRSHWHLD